MTSLTLIAKYYDENSPLYELLVKHSRQVADKALEVVKRHQELMLDADFVYEAAMLHDIGIFLTDANDIGCRGSYPYLCHGYLGAELLRREGFPRHALVCERHTGAGISFDEITRNNLPLPHRDMLPLSLEEQLICYADKFFSKSKPDAEKPLEKIVKGMGKHGNASVERFVAWHNLFS